MWMATAQHFFVLILITVRHIQVIFYTKHVCCFRVPGTSCCTTSCHPLDGLMSKAAWAPCQTHSRLQLWKQVRALVDHLAVLIMCHAFSHVHGVMTSSPVVQMHSLTHCEHCCGSDLLHRAGSAPFCTCVDCAYTSDCFIPNTPLSFSVLYFPNLLALESTQVPHQRLERTRCTCPNSRAFCRHVDGCDAHHNSCTRPFLNNLAWPHSNMRYRRNTRDGRVCGRD
jgi:hypothetical protein